MSGLTKTNTKGIYRTPSDRYRVRVRDSRGSMVERTFDTMADAKAFRIKVCYEKQAGLDVDRRAARTTFKEYAEDWRTRQPQHRPGTRAVVESRLRLHVYPGIGTVQIGAIRPAHLEQLVRHLTTELSPSSVHGVINLVATILNDAVQRQVIARSPCAGLKRPIVPERDVPVPTPSEVRALIHAAEPRYRALCLLLAGTGLRISEALAVTCDSIDIDRHELRVDHQLSWAQGQHSFTPVKTNRPRRVPVPRMLLAELDTHIARYGIGPNGLIFTSANGEPIKRTSFSNGAWQRALRGAGVAPFGVHGLRHFYASALIDQGESVTTVAARLGHRDVKETLHTYSHLWPTSDDKTREIVSSFLYPPTGPQVHHSSLRTA